MSPKPTRTAAAFAAAIFSLAPSALASGAPDRPEPYTGPRDFRLAGEARTPEPRRPIMLVADTIGVGSTLDDLALEIHGYAQAGYTYNPDLDSGDLIFGRVFDDEFDNHLQLDQVALSIRRGVFRDKWDLGGKVEAIYGYDTFRFHAAGLNHYEECGDGLFLDLSEQHDPLLQLDLTQAYADLSIPLGNGLLIRAGKFVTPLGLETIDPTTTPFYSRSYLFGFAKPFTHTGVMANYRFGGESNTEWDLWAGAVRGWDVATEDEGSLSALAQIAWRPAADWEVRLGGIFGRESDACECDCVEGLEGDRLLIDLVVSHALSDRLIVAAEALYGRDSAADPAGDSAHWYGAAGYASHEFGRRFTANARLEWFHDGDGTRLQTGEDLELFSLTAGLTFTPFPDDVILSHLKIRPEVRYDHADTPEFDGGTDHDQVTVAVSVWIAM